ncbi:MAG: hypothetical protein MUF42_05310 [Cytophagaceae bacterium]|jgi:hypothetical protein|nr:hypothetical protein [Cytophagaceae bacterium]
MPPIAQILIVCFSMLVYGQQKPVFLIRCLEKPDSLGQPFAERNIELNKHRQVLTSEYLFAKDARKRNHIHCRYDSKGRLISREEYAWSNYLAEYITYDKLKTIHEIKYNTVNRTHEKRYKPHGKLDIELVYKGMKSLGDTLQLSHLIRYHYDAKDSLSEIRFYRKEKDTSCFERVVRTFEGDQLRKEASFSGPDQISYREIQYDSLGRISEESFWDIQHPSNWELYKYSYPDRDSKISLRSNLYLEEWTLYVNGEIRLRKIYDITSEGVLMRQWEEYSEIPFTK